VLENLVREQYSFGRYPRGNQSSLIPLFFPQKNDLVSVVSNKSAFYGVLIVGVEVLYLSSDDMFKDKCMSRDKALDYLLELRIGVCRA